VIQAELLTFRLQCQFAAGMLKPHSTQSNAENHLESQTPKSECKKRGFKWMVSVQTADCLIQFLAFHGLLMTFASAVAFGCLPPRHWKPF